VGSDWLTGVTRLPSEHDGGSMLGGPPRWVWHTFEAGYTLSAMSAARYLLEHGLEVHFTFNPRTGDIVQILPASRAGRGLRNLSGGVQTNRQGKVCLQVEVVGYAAHPFTAALTAVGRAGLARLVDFARSHGIPDVFPAGPPPAYPGGSSPRSVSTWTTEAGHYGHSQIPENDHGDPGAIDVRELLGITPPPSTEGAAEVALLRIPDGSIWLVDAAGKRRVGLPVVVQAIADSTGAKVVDVHTAELDNIPTVPAPPDLGRLRADIVADIKALLGADSTDSTPQ
jgi:hypothetical protein